MFTRVALAWAVAALSVVASAQSFQRYGTEAGLPIPVVTSLAQDGTGFLWVGTLDGLCRFDGIRFDCFRPDPDRPGALAHGYVNVGALLADTYGRIWVGSEGGLQRFDPETESFVHVGLDDLTYPNVTSLAQAPDGALWAGTTRGLNRIDPRSGDVRGFLPAPGQLGSLADGLIRSVAVGSDGTVWVGTRSGLQRLRSGSSRFESIAPSSGPAEIYAIHPRPGGGAWVGSFGQGLWDVSPAGRTRRIALPPAADRIVRISPASSTDLWVGTWGGGLLRIRSTDGRLLDLHQADPTDPSSIPSDRVVGILQGPGETQWMATWDGLVRYVPPSPFRTRTPPPSHSPAITAVETRPGESVLLGTLDGVYVAGTNPNSAELARPLPAAEGLEVRALESAPADILWVGTETDGVVRVDLRSGTRSSPLADRLPSLLIHALHLDSSGRLWVGMADGGVCIWTPGPDDLTCFGVHAPAPHTLPTNEIYALEGAPNGDVVVGTLGSGVFRIASDLSHVDRVAPETPQLARARVASFGFDREETLWVATFDGLYRIPSTGPVRHYGTAEGLPHPNASCALPDRDGRIWMGTGDGLAALDPATGRIARYGTREGLPHASFFLGACAATPNALWLGTREGAVGFSPSAVETTGPAPRLVLTGLEIDGQPTMRAPATSARAVLAPGAQQLRVEFAGLDLARPLDVRYAYRLDGASSEWVDLGETRFVSLQGLHPGRYTLMIRATGPLGLSADPATVTIAVEAPVWQRWWFLLASAALLAALAWGAHRYHVARALEVERARQRIADDLHDSLGSRISGLSVQLHLTGRNASSEVGAQIRAHGEQVQALASDLRDVVWAVDASHDTLGALVDRVHWFALDLLPDVSLEIDADGCPPGLPLGMNERRHLLSFCREALHNVAKHARARAVGVFLAVRGHTLVVEISDDGVGLPEPLPKTKEGRGLQTLSRRARDLGGQLQTVSEEGGGVRHTLVVPLTAQRKRMARSRDGHHPLPPSS